MVRRWSVGVLMIAIWLGSAVGGPAQDRRVRSVPFGVRTASNRSAGVVPPQAATVPGGAIGPSRHQPAGPVKLLSAAAEELPPPPVDAPPVAPPDSAEGRPRRITIPLAGADARANVTISRQGELLSLEARDATLGEVLTLLAQTYGLNLVLVAPVDMCMTLTLDRITVDEAFDSVLSTAGCVWSRRGRIIYVSSLDGDRSVAPNVQGRELRVFELDYSSAVDMDLAVKGLLSPVGQSFVYESMNMDNRRTREMIAVEDLPSYVERIQAYVAQIDQPPRQVLIEAHVLEVDLKDEHHTGVDFEHVAKFAGTKLKFQTTGFANPKASPAFFVDLDGPNLTALIEALKTTTDAKMLASPRVLAVNGQEARIQVGQQLGYRVITTTQTSTMESVEFLDTGVVLRVTPRISRDNCVLMRIKPEISSGDVNLLTGLPEEETTEVETDVLLADGRGMIIGGLIKEIDDTKSNKIAVLGDLRYIGPLFQYRKTEKRRLEVIVALIPYILPYHPALQYRDDCQFMQARTPLYVGPLCRVPRPFEPRLPDPCLNPRLGLLDCPCGPPAGGLRRLPPIAPLPLAVPPGENRAHFEPIFTPDPHRQQPDPAAPSDTRPSLPPADFRHPGE